MGTDGAHCVISKLGNGKDSVRMESSIAGDLVSDPPPGGGFPTIEWTNNECSGNTSC